MGVDAGAVVDPQTMRVHGLGGVRVVDASVMPYITNANIYAPVVMLAEKAADLMRGRAPLEPIDSGFYTHGATMGGAEVAPNGKSPGHGRASGAAAEGSQGATQ